MSAEITARGSACSWMFCKLVATCMEQFRPKTTPPLAVSNERHCEEVYGSFRR
jgi:ATP-dependent DNA helicase DinG